VASREILAQYPIEDSNLVNLFKNAIMASKAAGNIPRVAIFDVVSSLPGLRMPFEELTAVCKQEGVFSLIDGAHGIGHVHLDLSALDPDFFVSNCHKWLFVPRGCAVFYVPIKNQKLMRSSLPTSHGFVPLGGNKVSSSPLPPSSKSEFVNQFEFVGTIDNTSYLTVPEAIKWREEVCGGENAIIEYNTNLAPEGGKIIAKILGTKTLDNSTGTLTNCCLINILLPLTVSDNKLAGINTIKPEHEMTATQWMEECIVKDYKSFLPIYSFQGQWWVRLSGQVYLELSDFEWAGKILKEICHRAGNGEFLKSGKEIDDKEMAERGDTAKDGIEGIA
jgi:selenocysteine lyase/cysteine desulfurase